jgi:hypothetical protein
MSHSPLCLWKQQRISEKLKRQITADLVHTLCNYLMEEHGLTTSEQVAAWIDKASPEELEEAIRLAEERRKRRRKRLLYGSEAEAYEYAYVG